MRQSFHPALTFCMPIDSALHHAIQLLRELDTVRYDGITDIEPALLIWMLEQREPALLTRVKADDQLDELSECLRFLQRLRAKAASHHVEEHIAAEAAISYAFDDCELSRPTRADYEHVLLRNNYCFADELACRVVRVLRATMRYGERSVPPGHPQAWAARATGRRIAVSESVTAIEDIRLLFAEHPHTCFIASVDALPESLTNATVSPHLLVVDASRHNVSSFGQGFDRRHWHFETRAFRNTALHTSLVGFFALESGAVLLQTMELFAHASDFGSELPVLYVGAEGSCLVVYPISVTTLQRQFDTGRLLPLEQMRDEHRDLNQVQTISERMPSEAGPVMPILNLHLADLDTTLDGLAESAFPYQRGRDYVEVPNSSENMLDIALSVKRQDSTSAWVNAS